MDGVRLRKVAINEWLWVLAASLVVIALTTVPYAVGFLASTPERVFTGAFYDLSDYNSHLAKMQQGYRGSWEYRLLFTPEEHRGGFVHPFYLALGHLARIFNLSLPFTYHLARVVWGFIYLLVGYRFIALFTEGVPVRRMAFLLAAMGSGIGWLTEVIHPTPPYGISPIDFWLSDFYVFFSIFAFPHFPASSALMLLCFIVLLKPEKGPGPLETTAAIILSLGLGLIHPYMMPFVDVVLGIFWGLEALKERRIPWRKAAALAAMGMAQLPLLLYNYLLFTRNPLFAGWTAQNVTLSPPLHYYVLGMGLAGILAAAGAIHRLRKPALEKAFPMVWIAAAMAMAYGPWKFQRRLTEGVMLPVGILAAWGWHEIVAPWLHRRGVSPRLAGSIRAGLIAFAAVSNLFMMVGFTAKAIAGDPMFFYPAEVVKAVDWLGRNSGWRDTVFASYRTGGLIAARIGHRVVLGHRMETVNYPEKKAAVEAFFGSAISPEDKCALLERYEVAYVFYGPYEREMGGQRPDMLPCLKRVFEEKDVSILRFALQEVP